MFYKFNSIKQKQSFVDNTNKMNKSKQKYQNEEDLKDSMKIETDKMFQVCPSKCLEINKKLFQALVNSLEIIALNRKFNIF